LVRSCNIVGDLKVLVGVLMVGIVLVGIVLNDQWFEALNVSVERESTSQASLGRKQITNSTHSTVPDTSLAHLLPSDRVLGPHPASVPLVLALLCELRLGDPVIPGIVVDRVNHHVSRPGRFFFTGLVYFIVNRDFYCRIVNLVFSQQKHRDVFHLFLFCHIYRLAVIPPYSADRCSIKLIGRVEVEVLDRERDRWDIGI
jgi:hypothetical protein